MMWIPGWAHTPWDIICLALFSVVSMSCRPNTERVAAALPADFVGLTIYDCDSTRQPLSEPQRLSAIPHVQLGTGMTRQLLGSIRYHTSSPRLWKGSYLGVAALADGRESILAISKTMGFFAVDRIPGRYEFMGVSRHEIDRILRASLERVFAPARENEGRIDPKSPVPIRIGAKYGYVDASGTMVIAPRFDDAQAFSEGLAAVRIGNPEDGKWGYINASGELVILPQFAGASFFCEGMAAVTAGEFLDGKQGYINQQGIVVIRPEFELAGGFRNGFAIVRRDARTFRIDSAGRKVGAAF